MNQILESTVKIQFPDCDPFGHLNNAKYLDYFINARENQVLENYGIDIFEEVAKKGKSWVVLSNQIAYFKPALPNEVVCIQSYLIDYSNKDSVVEMKMFDKEKTHLKALLRSKFVYFDVTQQKSIELSDDYKNIFESVLVKQEWVSFEESIPITLKEFAANRKNP